MTGAEVRKLSDEEIQIETKRLRGRLVTLRTQVVTEKVEDTSQFRKVKKDIARMLTEASARSAKSSKK
jgi:ribosomal protein L29